MAVSNVGQAASGPPDKLVLLRRHPLFGRLPPRVIEHLGSCMRKRALVRGETIFAKGDPGSGLMGVLSGSVKISVAVRSAQCSDELRKFLAVVQEGN
jgi:CRP/FNR family transcriptional regulator, cyclic AMP receptor protein